MSAKLAYNDHQSLTLFEISNIEYLDQSINFISVSPSIDKGQAGSKTVRTNRTAIWQIKCRGGKTSLSFVPFVKNGQSRGFSYIGIVLHISLELDCVFC